ncbi:MAG: hypothetical protein V3V81_05610 [Candidatus Bathyarchaeia archaeon]
MSITTDMEGNRIAKGSLKQLFKNDPEFLIRHVLVHMVDLKKISKKPNKIYVRRDDLQKTIITYFNRCKVKAYPKKVNSYIKYVLGKEYLMKTDLKQRLPRANTMYEISLDKLYCSCEVCGLHFEEELWARKCENYCTKYNACSIEITSHAIELK